ncbi:hypothetical protein TWF703_006655 [Orbilia oligospora]|uniref:Uncharacterized protein n=1 Tax=Orbilia oligospora TaxID=2813651 RepID=A0A7C8JQW2_ORBOL|nr:hypothetical protein TWF703_006655 [Orbilia oligospora]
MDTTSIILISVFSTLVFVLALVVLYFVLHRKVTIIPQTSQWGSTYTIRERRPFMDLFRRKDKKGRAPIPRRGSDAWDANISEEELGILRPARSNHSRAPSDPFQDPYDPHIPNDEESSLPHYSAPPPTHAYRPGTSTPSTSVADTSQPRFTPTSSPPRHSPPPSIIHHIDSFRLETLETTITDIRLTLDSANTILTQVSDLSSLPEEDDTPPLLTPADLAKINELSSLTTFHTELLQQQQQTGGRGIDAYTTKLPKFKTLVAQGMSIIMAAEGRRTKALGHSGHTLPSNSGNTFASFFSTAPNPSSSSTSATSTRPQEVKKTQLLSRYADLKKTESFAKNSLRQIIERREARRGSPGSENREMELEVRMLGLRAFRERVVVGRKLGVEDDDDEGEEIWGLDGVDGEVGGERVVVSPVPPSGRTGRTLVREEDEEEGEVPVPPPPAYDERLEREREALLDSKELN